MKKIWIGWIGASAVAVLGMLLRLNAQAMAWPESYSYSGSRLETQWARQEDAIGQIGLFLMGLGGLLFVVTYACWLFRAEADKPDKPEASA